MRFLLKIFVPVGALVLASSPLPVLGIGSDQVASRTNDGSDGDKTESYIRINPREKCPLSSSSRGAKVSGGEDQNESVCEGLYSHVSADAQKLTDLRARCDRLDLAALPAQCTETFDQRACYNRQIEAAVASEACHTEFAVLAERMGRQLEFASRTKALTTVAGAVMQNQLEVRQFRNPRAAGTP